MKKLFALITAALLIMPLYAEDAWKELSFLASVKKINLVIDYSEADIVGEDFEDFVQGEKEWDTYEQEIRSKFVRAFNQEANDGDYPHRVGNYEDSKYTLVLKVKTVTKKGSEIHTKVLVTNQEGKVVFVRDDEWCEKGKYGSVPNLMGDAMGKMGMELGKKFFFNARF